MGLIADGYNIFQNERKWKADQQNLEYQKALQKQIFEREDTAYQRTAKDMLAAGLNPLSMQGTNGAGEAISTQAPEAPQQLQSEGFMTQIEKAINGMTTLQQTKDQLKTNEQNRRYQKLEYLMNYAKNSEEVNNLKLSNEEKKLINEHLRREYKYMEDNELYDYDEGITKQAKGLITYLTTANKKIKQQLESQFPWIKYVKTGVEKGYLSKDELNELKKESPLMYFFLSQLFGQSEITTTFGSGKQSTTTGNSIFQNLFGF